MYDNNAEESRDGDESQNNYIAVHVREVATGQILRGASAPKAEELDAWLETHPGYEVVSRDEVSGESSEDEVVEPIAPTGDEMKMHDELEGLDEEERNRHIIEVFYR
jgi:SWI/SNF-related matrix-associated actin-dependent regulator of chromatin subfamily A protein 2/4